MKRHTYPSQFRLDPASQDRLLWTKAALDRILDGTRVSQSTIVRRALALYSAHLENIMDTTSGETKPRLTQAEGHQIHHHSQEQRVPWKGEFPAEELQTVDGSFPKFSTLLFKHRAMQPKVSDKLAAEVANWEHQEFVRRGD